MPALVRRHRLFVAVLSCALLVCVGWVWVSHLLAANPAGPALAAQVAAHPGFKPHSIDPNLNANTKSVAEAKKDGKHPERLSPLFMPADFDKAKFDANPQAYLDVVEPGRVWQTADPAANVVRLNTQGTGYVSVAPGGNVDLVAIGVPKAPVTFLACDGGEFDNQLNCMTVRADGQGEAHVTFTAVAGTNGVVKVMAGSPSASDQVEFWVTVEEPK